MEWERALTHHFLMVGSGGDASPIRSFEVSDGTIAEAAGLSGPDARELAMASFTRHVVQAGGLPNALRLGLHPNMDAQGLPGCFAYLVLTLYVASLRGNGEERNGDFRHKLRRFLGSERSFMNMPGVARMWAGLQRWLARRRLIDVRFRELVFPEVPVKWSHIGISLKFAFPTKTDATLMASFLHDKPAAAGDPRRLLAEFAPVIDRGRRSAGMADAFEDFRDAFAAGERLLEDHRFWRLVRSCSTGGRAEASSPAYVSCGFDEEAQLVFSAALEDGTKLSPGPRTLSEAVSDLAAAGGPAASSPAYLVFRQTGFGRWKSTEGFERAGPRVRLGLPRAAHRRLQKGSHRFVESGDWLFTAEPVRVALAEEMVASFTAAPSSERLASISVSGGVRTGGLWLGRPAFMPYVDAGGSELLVRAGPGAAGTVSLDCQGRGPERLQADGPVSGTWFLEPPGGRQRSCRQVAFAPNAQPHRDALAGDEAGEILLDWAGGSAQARFTGQLPAEAGWSQAQGAMSDLVEAVYAGGRRGWDEGDLVAIVGEAFGEAADPWAMLRVLRDATVVQPRLRHRWRGRTWTLQPPALMPWGNGAVVQGAVCEAEADVFRKAAASVEAVPFRVQGPSDLAPPLTGCVGGDLQALAARMGWRIEQASICPDERPLAFRETDHTLLGKEPASRWDWEAAKFVADRRRGDGAVSLTRWTQAASRDHDVYQVLAEGRERRLHSRDAALVLAHCLARRPLFTVAGGYLEVQVRGAFLPDAIAAQLRLSTLANAGLVDGRPRYRVTPEDAARVARLLPGAVAGAARAAVGHDADRVASVRHSSGRIRAAWTGGALTTLTAGGPGWGRCLNEGS
ncbi:hypothetical protein EEDFHM_03903 [Methylorubrum populi]